MSVLSDFADEIIEVIRKHQITDADKVRILDMILLELELDYMHKSDKEPKNASKKNK